jgi:hypothetical protein
MTDKLGTTSFARTLDGPCERTANKYAVECADHAVVVYAEPIARKPSNEPAPTG